MLRFIKGFGWALAGIRHVILTQHNMKIHLAAALVVVMVCTVLLDMPPVELAIITVVVFMVLAAEVFNTAVEAVVDLCSPGRHPLAGIAKDAAAGAVLLTALNALVVAGILIWPRLRNLLWG